MKYFLSIDYGGTNTKAIVFDEEGRQLGQSAFSTKKIEEKADCPNCRPSSSNTIALVLVPP